MSDSDKHSSLLRYGINYRHKKFIIEALGLIWPFLQGEEACAQHLPGVAAWRVEGDKEKNVELFFKKNCGLGDFHSGKRLLLSNF